MTEGIYRYFSPLSLARPRKRGEPQPILDTAADHEWLRANPDRLGRVHVVPLDIGIAGLAVWPTYIIAVRVHDTCQPEGWRPAWLELTPAPAFDDDDTLPDFTAQDWADADLNPIRQAQMILELIEHAARTNPAAMLIRDLLVGLREAELGRAADAFAFIPLDD